MALDSGFHAGMTAGEAIMRIAFGDLNGDGVDDSAMAITLFL
jgi:hypothetical protein